MQIILIGDLAITMRLAPSIVMLLRIAFSKDDKSFSFLVCSAKMHQIYALAIK